MTICGHFHLEREKKTATNTAGSSYEYREYRTPAYRRCRPTTDPMVCPVPQLLGPRSALGLRVRRRSDRAVEEVLRVPGREPEPVRDLPGKGTVETSAVRVGESSPVQKSKPLGGEKWKMGVG